MSLPSFVQLMASLGLQDTPALPRARHHRTASSSSSYSTSTSTAHAFSPWSSDPSVQTLVCPHPDASNPATADSHHSTASTLSYSSQSSFRSSNAAPSPAIVVSAAEASPVSHNSNWDTERERERALNSSKKSARYAPYKTETRDVFTNRRGSLPGTANEMSDILHDNNHNRSPSPAQSSTSRTPSNQVSPVRPTFAGHNQTASLDSDIFSVDGPQDNVSTLRQSQPRISRRARCARSRGHLRTASNPLISPSRPHGRAVNMLFDPDMSNTSPVASISSLLRKSDHPSGFLQTGAPVTAPASAPSSAHPHMTTFSFNGPASAIPAGANPRSSSTAPHGKYKSSNMLWAEGNTRSFSQRPRRMGARNEPPAPLTIPTLPSSFVIPPIPSLPPIPHTSGGSYVSRRDGHSADGPQRRSPAWRSRKSTSPPVQPAPIEVAMES